MKQLTINPNNKRFYSEDFIKGFECGTQRQLEADKADIPTWIPCSERMPEYRKTVLISTFWGVKTGFLDSTEPYGDFWVIIEDDADAALHSIYAWMPLPEPWEGADDEAD